MPRVSTAVAGSLADRIDDCLSPDYEDLEGITALLREISHAKFVHGGVQRLDVKKMTLEHRLGIDGEVSGAASPQADDVVERMRKMSVASQQRIAMQRAKEEAELFKPDIGKSAQLVGKRRGSIFDRMDEDTAQQRLALEAREKSIDDDIAAVASSPRLGAGASPENQKRHNELANKARERVLGRRGSVFELSDEYEAKRQREIDQKRAVIEAELMSPVAGKPKLSKQAEERKLNDAANGKAAWSRRDHQKQTLEEEEIRLAEAEAKTEADAEKAKAAELARRHKAMTRRMSATWADEADTRRAAREHAKMAEEEAKQAAAEAEELKRLKDVKRAKERTAKVLANARRKSIIEGGGIENGRLSAEQKEQARRFEEDTERKREREQRARARNAAKRASRAAEHLSSPADNRRMAASPSSAWANMSTRDQHKDQFLGTPATRASPKTGRPRISPRQDDPSRTHAAGSIFDRLTDARAYTGAHKMRFDKDGRGRGKLGRQESQAVISDISQIVNSHKVDHQGMSTRKIAGVGKPVAHTQSGKRRKRKKKNKIKAKSKQTSRPDVDTTNQVSRTASDIRRMSLIAEDDENADGSDDSNTDRSSTDSDAEHSEEEGHCENQWEQQGEEKEAVEEGGENFTQSSTGADDRERVAELRVSSVLEQADVDDRHTVERLIDVGEEFAPPSDIIKSTAQHSKRAKNQQKAQASGTIFDRLSDTSGYTGTHKMRFDQTGRGRGKLGRQESQAVIADLSQIVGAHKVDHQGLSTRKVTHADTSPQALQKTKKRSPKASPSRQRIPKASSTRHRTPTRRTRAATPNAQLPSGRKGSAQSPRCTAKTPRSPRSASPGKPINSAGSGNVFDKLTDTSAYTGAHKLRFDKDGRGRGKLGRRESQAVISDLSQIVGAHKMDHQSLSTQKVAERFAASVSEDLQSPGESSHKTQRWQALEAIAAVELESKAAKSRVESQTSRPSWRPAGQLGAKQEQLPILNMSAQQEAGLLSANRLHHLRAASPRVRSPRTSPRRSRTSSSPSSRAVSKSAVGPRTGSHPSRTIEQTLELQRTMSVVQSQLHTILEHMQQLEQSNLALIARLERLRNGNDSDTERGQAEVQEQLRANTARIQELRAQAASLLNQMGTQTVSLSLDESSEDEDGEWALAIARSRNDAIERERQRLASAKSSSRSMPDPAIAAAIEAAAQKATEAVEAKFAELLAVQAREREEAAVLDAERELLSKADQVKLAESQQATASDPDNGLSFGSAGADEELSNHQLLQSVDQQLPSSVMAPQVIVSETEDELEIKIGEQLFLVDTPSKMVFQIDPPKDEEVGTWDADERMIVFGQSATTTSEPDAVANDSQLINDSVYSELASLMANRHLESSTTHVEVTVPEGCTAGDVLTVDLAGDRELDVTVPPGLGPGDVFDVAVEDDFSEDDTHARRTSPEEFSDSEWDEARAGDAVGHSRDSYARRRDAQQVDRDNASDDHQNDSSPQHPLDDLQSTAAKHRRTLQQQATEHSDPPVESSHALDDLRLTVTKHRLQTDADVAELDTRATVSAMEARCDSLAAEHASETATRAETIDAEREDRKKAEQLDVATPKSAPVAEDVKLPINSNRAANIDILSSDNDSDTENDGAGIEDALLQKAWAAADTDGSGDLDADEVLQVLLDMGSEREDLDIDFIMSQIAGSEFESGDTVSFEAFHRWFSQRGERVVHYMTPSGQRSTVFHAFVQLVNDGTVSTETMVWEHGMSDWMPLRCHHQLLQSVDQQLPSSVMAPQVIVSETEDELEIKIGEQLFLVDTPSKMVFQIDPLKDEEVGTWDADERMIVFGQSTTTTSEPDAVANDSQLINDSAHSELASLMARLDADERMMVFGQSTTTTSEPDAVANDSQLINDSAHSELASLMANRHLDESSPTHVEVTVPEGCTAGDVLTVDLAGDRELDVTVPPGLGPGDVFDVAMEDDFSEDDDI